MLEKNKFFFIPYFLFIIAGAIILLTYSKDVLHLFINQYHNSFSDTFFKYTTYLAEGVFVGIVIVVLAFFKFRYALLLFSSLVFSSVMAQFFKRVLFNEIPRPKAYFEDLAQLHFVEGVQVHSHLSFPSGHATTAFALFTALALIIINQKYKMLLFFLALIVSWSRIHLSQHFFIDIYFGSLLGVSCTLIVFWFFNYKVKPVHSFDNSIPSYFRKKNK